MEMTLRWYGPGYDSVTLEQIRQIPGVKGVITTLMGKQAGELWTLEEILDLKKTVEEAGLKIAGIESVNVSDDIKIGTPKREEHIANYIATLENLGKADIHMVCYNFMPVFDWTRTDMARPRKDGSTVLAYNQETVDKIDPQNMKESVEKMSNGFIMPGWEPERLEHLEKLFGAYADTDAEKLFNNLVYFLEAIGDVCEKYDIRMGIHPDDPAWPIFGLPRIITNKEQVERLLRAVDKPYNGITLCTGSLGSNPKNDIVGIIKAAKGRIPFAHVRNLKYNYDGDFEEAAHLSSDGSMDMHAIMKALYETGFDAVIRPDHGRMVWGEKAMPGYGLYDRAMGAAYLQGLWEAIDKENGQRGNRK
ncbi:MAG: mannonate dehydratase [Clostridia bacterium]|nr:mannonate dehydratase [Clostridia bacterium]